MRFSVIVACLSACLAPAAALSVFNGNAPNNIAGDGQKIPGESPLTLCPGGDHKKDIVQIERVDLIPNPPQAGKQLVIKATGTVRESIDQGAYVKLSVKYGLITLINTKADLCEQVGNVDLECPIEAGNMTITKAVELPTTIPVGVYTVVADVYTKDGAKITCLTATVKFENFFSNEL